MQPQVLDFVQKTEAELYSQKNAIFKETITSNISFEGWNRKPLKHRIVIDDDDYIALKLGNKKHITIEDDNLETKVFDGYQSVYILFYNTPTEQLMFIQKDERVFKKTEQLKDWITYTLNRRLETKGIHLEVFSEIESHDFWNLLEKYHNRIRQMTFSIAFNLPHARSKLKESFKQLSKGTGSVLSKVELNAPEEGVLINLNKENEELGDLAELTQNAHSAMFIRVLGLKRKVTTRNITKEESIDVIEGKPADVKEIIDLLVNKSK